MRVTYVKSARKAAGTCVGCGKPVAAGEPYAWVSNGFRSRSRKVRHSACMPFRPSETTANYKLGMLYDAQAEADSQIALWQGDDASEVAAILEECASTVREVQSEYEESAQSIEDGFGHATQQSEEATDNASACEDWADALENWSWDNGEYAEPAEGEEAEYLDIDAWREAVRDEATDLTAQCPL